MRLPASEELEISSGLRSDNVGTVKAFDERAHGPRRRSWPRPRRTLDEGSRFRQCDANAARRD
jgi:hypothetical protein